MALIPSKIYDDYQNNRIDKKKAIDLLITLVENVEDSLIRKESIEVLGKIDFKYVEVFKILENIFISDSDEDLRFSAAKILSSKFSKKTLVPFLWALQHESSYNTLITIIKSLEEIGDKTIDSILLKEMKKFDSDKFDFNLIPIFTENNLEQLPKIEIGEILINNITIKSFTTKFDKIKYETENGMVVKLDFSHVDNQVINWKDRDALEDRTDILGIQNLKYLENIELFPIQWSIKNEFTFKISIALITSLERLNNEVAKKAIKSQLTTISNEKFKSSIKAFTNVKTKFDNLSLSQLSEILTNYLSISFLKKKYPSLDYNAEKGEVVSIKIEGESLITLPKFIQNFRSLGSLVLKNCRLASLPESIGSFIHLQVLDLEGNNLKTLPKAISSLSSLRMLNLSNNQLIKVPYALGTLTSLQYLNLKTNNLGELPRSIGYLSSLKYFNVRGNNLKKIPPSIGSLKSLQTLNLSLNKLKDLPRSIGLLYSLENLNLDHNNLTELPKSLNTISSLKVLSLEENELISLPESMELLKSLEILKLGWNKLVKIPISIGTLVSLKYLRLTSNQLEKFPESYSSLSSLEFLDASYNKIKILPENIGEIRSLKVFKLSDNLLEQLPDSICSLSLLENLNVSGNNIIHLPVSIGSLLSLKEIWLNGNKLKDLPESIGKLKSLKKLKLINNQLTELPKTLVDIHSLEEISLNWKNIENVSDFNGHFK
jgi:Leucine-rich repeat (LRR) protein